jgi:hypothetical protein
LQGAAPEMPAWLRISGKSMALKIHIRGAWIAASYIASGRSERWLTP